MKIGNIYDEVLGEDYPATWDLEEFKKLTSFNQRIKYCQTHLKRLSSGSSRIVYKIDDEKVLKLAKNKKGLAQNEIEASYSQYPDIDDIIAKVFAYHQDDLWIEMELARKVTPQIFKNVTGFSFDDYTAEMNNHWLLADNRNKGYKQRIDPDIRAQMWEDEFCFAMFDFMASYEAKAGDLGKINSYGLVHRNGQDRIVLIDYGLNNDVWDSYYT